MEKKAILVRAYTLSECMELTAEKIAKLEEKGERNVVFCEDRLTLIAERAIVKRTGGTFLSSVTTFARFLRSDEKVLSAQGSVMAIAKIMTDMKNKNVLRLFSVNAGARSLAQSIYETLALSVASGITPEILRSTLPDLPEGILKNKVADLADICEEYGKFLTLNGYVDESTYLSRLPKSIRDGDRLNGANVFFLCYGSFTVQATEIIKAVGEKCNALFGVFCDGEDGFYTGKAVRAFANALKESRTVETENLGTDIPAEAGTLAHALFNPKAGRTEKRKTDSIQIYEGEDKDAEAEFVAVQIKKILAKNADVRYRDFAVLLSDTAGYAVPFEKTFSEYGIPYFYDRKKSLKDHPLSGFVLDCFKVVNERFSPLSVQSLASNPFFGDSDEYRNYLLKFANFRGGAKREIKDGVLVEDFDAEALRLCREKLLKATKRIKDKDTGRGYANAVRAVMKDFDAENVLSDLEERTKDVAAKGYLSQIGKAMENLLSEAEELTGDTLMTCKDFSTVLSEGLKATEISLIPLKTDAVFIGGMVDSRIEKVRFLFAVGMTDDVPNVTTDTALISDREIEKLASLKACLEPTVADVNLRNTELFCLNLCTFTDKLFLTYPVSDSGCPISEVFRYVDLAFLDGNGKKIKRNNSLEQKDEIFLCSAPFPAVKQLILKGAEYAFGGADTRADYSALYEIFPSEGQTFLSLPDLTYLTEERKFAENKKVSPTQLEAFFDCPFKGFLSKSVELKERDESTVLAPDSGIFIHSLLQKIGDESASFSSEEQVRVRAKEIGEELLLSPLFSAQNDTDAGRYASNRLLKEGVEASAAIYRQLAGSSFKVVATEKEIATPDLHGKIDRVDCSDDFVRIVDYKTGKISDKALAYYTGRKLQLQLYMSAVDENKIPAGVFYFPASVSFSDENDVPFRMSGFMNGSADALKAGDKDFEQNGESSFFDCSASNVLEKDDFDDFLKYALLEAEQGRKEIRSGFIAPSPYSGACTFCAYGGICGFDPNKKKTRSEARINCKGIAQIVRETENKGENDGE